MTTLHVRAARARAGDRRLSGRPRARGEPRLPARRSRSTSSSTAPPRWSNGLPVAGDGTILRGLPVEGKLPTIEAARRRPGRPAEGPRRAPRGPGRRRGAGAAPPAPRARSSMRSGDGIVVEMREGPEMIFGDATRVRAKWIAATRVLADPEAEGATYIDVRLPGRPGGGRPARGDARARGPGGHRAIDAPRDGRGRRRARRWTRPPSSSRRRPRTTTRDPAPPEPQSAPAPAPASPSSAPAPTDSTGAGRRARRRPANPQAALELYANPQAML